MNKSFDILSVHSFSLIGKEGTPKEVEHLWNEAENHIKEVNGHIIIDSFGPSYWGVNGDKSFFAGFEMKNIIKAPEGWSRKEIGGGEYLVHYPSDDEEFLDSLKLMKKEADSLNRPLIGDPLDHAAEGLMAIYWLLG